MSVSDHFLSLCPEAPTSTWVPEGDPFTFRLGHSDARVARTVTKFGKIAEEMALVIRLGTTVCPYVYNSGDDWYTMEHVTRIGVTPNTLSLARGLLERYVWNIDGDRMFHEYPEWLADFRSRFGFDIPDWVVGEQWTYAHGDPTLANVIQTSFATVRIIDPKPHGRGIPSTRSCDIGKMMQSLLGWEEKLSGYWFPEQVGVLDGLDELTVRRAVFWCRVHLLRIVQREGDSPLGQWASDNADKLVEILV